jgi:hypothetical protein
MINPDDGARVLEGDIDLVISKVQSDVLNTRGSHNMLIYDDLGSFERFYSGCAARWLARNEIVLIRDAISDL